MIAFIGDSHTLALKDGWQLLSRSDLTKLEHDLPPVRFQMLGGGYKFIEPFFRVEGGRIRFEETSVSRNLAKGTEGRGSIMPRDPRKFIVSLGLHGLRMHTDKMWHHSTLVKGKSEKNFVSASAFGAMVENYNKHVYSFFQALKQSEVTFEVLAACPLPKRQWLKRTHVFETTEEYFAVVNGFRNIATRRIEDFGIVVHHPPFEVYDEEGFMKPQFVSDKRENDYHANGVYGAMMLRKIFNLPAA